MLPIGDSPRTVRTPFINLTLIAMNVLVFLYELSLGARVETFVDQWGVVPSRITAVFEGVPGSHPLVLATLFTAMFLHGGWLHIGGNMLFLWIFGDNVEDRLGHGLYLTFYVVCGIVANLAQVYSGPTSTVAAIGASGAIAGVLGAYLITFPGARISVLIPIFLFFWVLEIPALIVIGVWFLTQVFSGVAAFADVTSQSGGVAWWAHVGGFVFGALLMLVLPKRPASQSLAWSGSLKDRAREDSGLVGLGVGLVSLVSQVTQLILAARLIVVFFGAARLAQAFPLINRLLSDTTPFVRPFALFVPPLRLDGRLVELYTLAAILCVYLAGAVLISVICRVAYRPKRLRP